MNDDQWSIPDPINPEFRIFLDAYGAGGVYEIETKRGNVLFSWSDRFGPLPEKKNGEVRDLPWNHPFWLCASLWNLQGRRAEGNRAIWHKPRKPVYRIVGREIVEIIDEGEPGHDW